MKPARIRASGVRPRAEAAQVGNVDAGLDREDHARLEHGVVTTVEKWRLMPLEPDRVTRVVAQVVGDSKLFGEPDSGELDLARGDPGRHGLDAARLQREHGVKRTHLLR